MDWTMDWTVDCEAAVYAHAQFTFPTDRSAAMFFLKKEAAVAMDKSSAIVLSSDSESDSEVLLDNADLTFTPTKIKG